MNGNVIDHFNRGLRYKGLSWEDTKLIAERESSLREALEWYADVKHYKKDSSIRNPGGKDFIPVMADYGGYARDALRSESVEAALVYLSRFSSARSRRK